MESLTLDLKGNPMDDDLISVRDIAAQHRKRKQTVFKILKRLGIETTKQRSATGKNQLMAYITQDNFKLVRSELLTIRSADEAEDGESDAIEASAERGVFYLIQLEPEFDPCRLKVGFAASLPERLRHLRCSAPVCNRDSVVALSALVGEDGD
jgi:hypothetical protein